VNAERREKLEGELSDMSPLTMQNEYLFLVEVLDEILEQRDSYRNKCRKLLNNNSYSLEYDMNEIPNIYDDLI
jgi:hypothetical protein